MQDKETALDALLPLSHTRLNNSGIAIGAILVGTKLRNRVSIPSLGIDNPWPMPDN